MNNFFIVGNLRTGTTLITELLSEFKGITLLNQPFTQLFYGVKEQFHQTINYNGPQLLFNNYVNETAYTPEDFTSYLNQTHFTSEELIQWFSNHNRGQLSPFSLDIIHKYNIQGTLEEIISSLITHINSNDKVITQGFKQVLCEEFTPYFIKKGFKVIHILRDPRDMICSARSGNGLNYTGKKLPLLYELHNWRKSVSFALVYENNPNVVVVKFEDLLLEPVKALSRILNVLDNEVDIKNIQTYLDLFKIQANSSFNPFKGLSTEPLGRYKTHLSQQEIEYIEAICYWEMALLSYEIKQKPNLHAIESFNEDGIMGFDKLQDYNFRSINLNLEIQRLEQPTSKAFFSNEIFNKCMKKFDYS
ncbi:sulfotransferase domain-containing protein [Pseudoalteromonas sp. C2R02]|uniref:sulfotransferase domain-containing protein n=1 Tax=Pseudoalteromonas sp. C2R02 TaxID=2841565 RepID=UPI001C087927|nr:sulfotransferase domain-containing protein [Pseudoalteromonas sp. C2R02]MBU2971730.1 sulfotransferase domain-containing protein [Pseudoalteromonas sp. C2R02]